MNNGYGFVENWRTASSKGFQRSHFLLKKSPFDPVPLTGPSLQDITAQWHPLNLALQRKVGTYSSLRKHLLEHENLVGLHNTFFFNHNFK